MENDLKQIFLKTLERVYSVFKEEAMWRKGIDGEIKTRPNKALFDTLVWNFSVLTDNEFGNLFNNRNKFISDYQAIFATNTELQRAINDTTGNKIAVKNRFEKLNQFINNYTK